MKNAVMSRGGKGGGVQCTLKSVRYFHLTSLLIRSCSDLTFFNVQSKNSSSRLEVLNQRSRYIGLCALCQTVCSGFRGQAVQRPRFQAKRRGRASFPM